jgi:hypothetical protein
MRLDGGDGGEKLHSRDRKACVRVENCDAEVVNKFFEEAIESDLRHRENVEDGFWRRVGEREDEGRMDGMTGWISSQLNPRISIGCYISNYLIISI